MKVTLCGYELTLPDAWGRVEIRPADDGGKLLTVIISDDLELRIIVWPGGNELAVDRYFATVVRRFEDGTFRGFDLEHEGFKFRGWLLTACPSLGTELANFYGTVHDGNAICWAWYGAENSPVTFEDDAVRIVVESLRRHAVSSA